MNADDFRRIALSFPETQERSHFGKADFRVRDRIFASLPAPDRGVLNLTPGEQAILSEAEPEIFSPLKGGWGIKGWTAVALDMADEATLLSGLAAAWRNVAPPTLARR